MIFCGAHSNQTLYVSVVSLGLITCPPWSSCVVLPVPPGHHVLSYLSPVVIMCRQQGDM